MQKFAKNEYFRKIVDKKRIKTAPQQAQLVDLDKNNMSLRKSQISNQNLKFAKAAKLTEYIAFINENDFRPYSCEYSLIKNIAFVPNNQGIIIDLAYESKLMLCIWDQDSKVFINNEFILSQIKTFRDKNYALMN